jgi:hypothetical protein
MYNTIETKVKHEMGPSCMLIKREGEAIIACLAMQKSENVHFFSN